MMKFLYLKIKKKWCLERECSSRMYKGFGEPLRPPKKKKLRSMPRATKE